MALSGSFNSSAWTSSSGDKISLLFSWTATQSVDKNTSTISWELKGDRANSGYVNAGGFKVTIDGETVYSKSTDYRIKLYNGTAVASGTKKLTHNTDGTRSFAVYIEGGIYTYAVNCTGSATFALNTIPRASTMDSLSCSTNYFDGTLTGKYTPKSASYYNLINISLNPDTDYMLIRSVKLGKKAVSQQTQTITFTASELSAIYAAIPKSTTGIVRFTLRTYSDSGYSTQIGSASYSDIELTIPTEIAPTASLSVSPVNNNTWIKDLGIYVAGYSGLTASLSATAGEGASIASYSISGGDYSSTTKTLSVSKLASSGELKLTGKVKDSRGRSDTSAETITVEKYSNPVIASFSVERGTYDSGWTVDDDGPDLRVVFKATLALTGYSNEYSISFSLDGTTVTPDYGATAGLTSGSSMAVYFFDIDGESSYTLKITAKDKVGASGSATLIVPTINITMEFDKDGKGVAFGKTSEDGGFECGWPAYFSDAIYTKGFQVPEIQHGVASITPTEANVPISLEITFEKEFSGTPIVVATPVTSAPGTLVLGCGVYNRSKAGFTLYVTRSNTTETKITWIAMY